MDELITIDVTELPDGFDTALERAARVTGMARAYSNTVSSGILEAVAALFDGADTTVAVPRFEIPDDATWVLHEAADLFDTLGDTESADGARRLAGMLDTGTNAPDWAPKVGGVAVPPSGLA